MRKPDKNKPNKGCFMDWYPIVVSEPTSEHLGFYLRGMFKDHPVFRGDYGHTSMIVAVFPKLNCVETLNSRYTLELPRNPEVTIHSLFKVQPTGGRLSRR